MASRPGYNLNEFNRTSPDERLNRAIGVNFEPGSTFKAAAFAAALNEGIVTPETVFDTENGSWFYKGKSLRDVSRQSRLTVAEGLQKSSNILTAKMSLMLGNDRLYAYLRAFGIGSPLGIDLPGEESGIFHPPERWYGISPTRIPIGQGVATTALQVLTVFSTIANDGYRMRPYVVRRIRSSDGEVLVENQPSVAARVIRPDTAATMRWLLQTATEPGSTGTRARIAGIDVAGKTGTAQKPGPGGYSNTDYIASFVGFFPVQDPVIAMIVVADEPKPVTGGGRVAAPVFAAIGQEITRYMGLDRVEQQQIAVARP
jgi:cell division protein FtsI (penicillin-binding protein 3)